MLGPAADTSVSTYACVLVGGSAATSLRGSLAPSVVSPFPLVPETVSGSSEFKVADTWQGTILIRFVCSLAYAEMRLFMSRLIWNFDIELDSRSKGWLDQNLMYFLWEKPQLYIRLTPRKAA